MSPRLAAGLLVGLLAGCGWKPNVIATHPPSPAVEGGRVAEARVALPGAGVMLHDIWYAGVFETAEPIDLAVLREYCRPGGLAEVTEQYVPGIETITASMYTPRLVSFTCAGGVEAPP